jgi:hypothetical protein
MQNRSMFPYRRHGGKKRSKGGAARKSRGPQRPLPNSARDLLPLLQPATKALAQMLAGRAGVSGQLNHARNLLAHAERLIGDRVHNRLIPAEREEFFEQLARLRLTLADADAEAEVQAAEDQEEKRPPPPPVAQERLKEMALALSRPERDRPGSPRASGDPDDRASGSAGQGAAEAATPASSEAVSEQPGPAGASEPEERPLRPLATLPGRLVLSKTAGVQARSAVRPLVRRGSRVPAGAIERARDGGSRQAPSVPADPVSRDDTREPQAIAPDAGNGADDEAKTQERAKAARRGRKTKDGLPEGWVINEEGYVVPRHG